MGQIIYLNCAIKLIILYIREAFHLSVSFAEYIFLIRSTSRLCILSTTAPTSKNIVLFSAYNLWALLREKAQHFVGHSHPFCTLIKHIIIMSSSTILLSFISILRIEGFASDKWGRGFWKEFKELLPIINVITNNQYCYSLFSLSMVNDGDLKNVTN